MKYNVIIMAPQLVELEDSGDLLTVISKKAWELTKKYPSVHLDAEYGVAEFDPRVLVVLPKDKAPVAPLVTDPPPMAA